MPKLSITVKNTGTKSFEVNWDQSKVRVKGGTWKALGGGQNTCAAGDTVSITDNALFGSDANRRYQIYTVEDDNPFFTYYPSTSGWTTDSSPMINITRE
jgi:hypothetical protein